MELEEAKGRLKHLYKENKDTLVVFSTTSKVKEDYLKENEAIETILQELDRLQKENEKYISGELMTRNQTKHFEEITNKHYIHKNKIREKIEEYREQYKSESEQYVKDKIGYRILALDDLLRIY